MNHATNDAAADYKRVHAEGSVAEASPVVLIRMLLQRLTACLAQAELQMAGGVTNRKGELISDALSIIDCLRSSLNFDAGGDIAANLDALYDYMTRQLLLANMHDEPKQIAEVASLVNEIKEAWDSVPG